MRKNLPVTGHNIELSSSTNILSTTTPDSHITYVNPDFLKISGFAEEELIGSPTIWCVTQICPQRLLRICGQL